jgi:hypothetical protein
VQAKRIHVWPGQGKAPIAGAAVKNGA